MGVLRHKEFRWRRMWVCPPVLESLQASHNVCCVVTYFSWTVEAWGMWSQWQPAGNDEASNEAVLFSTFSLMSIAGEGGVSLQPVRGHGMKLAELADTKHGLLRDSVPTQERRDSDSSISGWWTWQFVWLLSQSRLARVLKRRRADANPTQTGRRTRGFSSARGDQNQQWDQNEAPRLRREARGERREATDRDVGSFPERDY
ncbi:hypothetical protein B0J13DRAFT_117689 [Dactylonectria estremocensis]|uniref:Uncharacterized protein n=1 Tax=Dactylonectria estremocensis TaxID=1079267 RepID=A0A9P9FFE7_9HYPO|nr:hypothetical protein B0J13DRAFT_117689 [Dactylonectria estremocensis]